MGEIRRAEVLRYLGYDGQNMDEVLARRIDAIIERCEKEQRSYGMHAVFPLSFLALPDGATVAKVLGTSLQLFEQSVLDYLDGATHCALIACTLGLRSEQTLRLLGMTSELDQVVYSCACSDLIERGADKVEAQVAFDAYRMGLYANYRFSPGFGDFSLSIQGEFLRVLAADKHLGISVTEGDLLIPCKSITAIVGLYPKPPKTAEVGCGACARYSYCEIRKLGQTCYIQKSNLGNK